MFHKILIANRGEIACRIAATARRLGVRTVAVWSDADAHAAHVIACDEAVRLGPSPARESYLRGDLVIEAALRTGAQAIHPGYGFLSEDAEFADACQRAGLVFIGPPARAMAAMGDKAAAKQRMQAAGVPLVPGYHGADQTPSHLLEQATQIGFPVLIKACAGGGGRGMRVVSHPSEFLSALASCQREAQASFGHDQVLLERYLPSPRHIEVQIFADSHGQCIHLFERDCSVQRRHQKVLEEAPAPGMSPLLRERMGQAAVLAAQSVGYVGAGTVEFIASQDVARTGQFYFMEMNTRLQVEHPVTEAITGIDLVEWQLRVARGERLPWGQEGVRMKGHAIEARICAENTAQGFLPSTGTLKWLRLPLHTAFSPGPLRIDAGVREGDDITPHYDSMIAKVIVHGDDRGQALQRLSHALAHFQIAGVQNNVDLLRRIVALPDFAQGRVHTHLIEEHSTPLFDAPAPHDVGAACLALAQHLSRPTGETRAANPWSRQDHWRLHGVSTQRWHLRWADTVWQVVAHHRRGLPTQWSLQGIDHPDLGPAPHTVVPVGDGAAFDVLGPSGTLRLSVLDPLARAPRDATSDVHATAALRAPMPGKVVAVEVVAGQVVTQGQRLAVTEAMKMEHVLCAPRDGTISDVLCQPGEHVGEGQELLRLHALSTEEPS